MFNSFSIDSVARQPQKMSIIQFEHCFGAPRLAPPIEMQLFV